MSVTRTFKVSGTATLLGIALVAVSNTVLRGFEGVLVPGILLLTFFCPVFVVSAIRHLLRGILWGVGSRLFVSYLLIGLVPLPLLAGLLYSGIWMITAQIAVRRAEVAVLARERDLLDLLEALEGVVDAPKGSRDEALAKAITAEASRLPEAGWALAGPKGVEGAGPIPPTDLLQSPVAPAWLKVDTEVPTYGVVGDVYLSALARQTEAGLLVVYVPLGRGLARSLGEELGLELSFGMAHRRDKKDRGAPPPNRGVSVDAGGDKTDIQALPEDDDEKEAPAPAPKKKDEPARTGPINGQWVHFFRNVDRPLVDWKTGTSEDSRRVTLLVHTSLAAEFDRLFHEVKAADGEEDRTPTGREIVVGVSKALGVGIASIYLVAAGIAALLVMRIARATSRLSKGFTAIEAGNFAFRAKLKGKDQLAGMIESFNRMAGHLQSSVAERAEKEALQHELSLARDLQRRLLPSSDFRFPGVEIATDFKPADAIGGDFYHFIAESPERLVVVIADVSGHGLGTGIVMASAKASLSALASTGVATPELFTTLDREIAATTDKRSFVTLGHARLDLSRKVLELTNAGHLYPYRLTAEGEVTTVPNPSRPLGLTLPVTFKTVSSPLAPGDVWVFMSDGIVEATNAAEEPFGFGRIESILKGCAGASAVAVRDRLLAAWRTHTGTDEPDDDRTLLVVRIESPKG